ncbi:hypothetical protein EV702DRAFT_701781 [Suillus placidus]|uniref:Major facilitator superfamily (MFS) profile domain-containing protein n=1 Tax=Suillus placidus TaxID=48579 RepID=A0A9P6ZJR6_9AGAM|nr:hypothetical protein EV702DRAFT_701781 [Suillus placidus]
MLLRRLVLWSYTARPSMFHRTDECQLTSLAYILTLCTAIGLAGCMISLSLESAMEARLVGLTPHTGDALGVLFIFCFICIYACGIDATSYVYCSEIFPSHIRAPGMAFSMTRRFLSTVVFLEVGPTALTRIG